ncbi:hypothetical protein SISNIDRAFT_163530 [Sistotremastrum niveocremeum HHB9708]|uniref:Uncharacterized protein n=1 Tax=Sistotremastrum niveocremeum HHB9708 TaxID=1314777 RepID=A0A164SDG9_9AGAM|nr:hypothetical protein SISNIDRAFT_163530 [Sistotremastrum niveocremeum HHB9708]
MEICSVIVLSSYISAGPLHNILPIQIVKIFLLHVFSYIRLFLRCITLCISHNEKTTSAELPSVSIGCLRFHFTPP